jgi:hypothetical protein
VTGRPMSPGWRGVPLPGVVLGCRDGVPWGYPLGAGRPVRARRVVRAWRGASWVQGAWVDRCRARRRAVVARCPAMETRRSRSRSLTLNKIGGLLDAGDLRTCCRYFFGSVDVDAAREGHCACGALGGDVDGVGQAVLGELIDGEGLVSVQAE